MQLVVTIYEETPEKAIEVIRALRDDHDAIELRVDAFGGQAVDWAAVRATTAKPVIATNRGGVPAVDANADQQPRRHPPTKSTHHTLQITRY